MTLKERYESALSFLIYSERNFSHFTCNPVSARSYSPKLPSSVNVSCSKILFFSSAAFPIRCMQLNFSLMNYFSSGNSTSISSNINESLKLRRLKGAIRSSKIVPGARLISNSFLMVHLRWTLPSSRSGEKLICPSNIRLVGNLMGLSLLNWINKYFLS